MYLEKWVFDQMQRGHYIFSRDDVMTLNTSSSKASISVALSRLVSRGVIMSPWRNFYVSIPIEYKLRGVVPPSFYIDRLMAFMGRNYYVSLLTAAELNGASHQRAMIFQVVVCGKSIRSGIKNGTRLDFTLRQNLPLEFVRKVKTQMGYMNVACSELTALDIVAEEAKIGGLSRAAEILVELSESTKWNSSKLSLLKYFASSTIQRLGYLLDWIGETEQATSLWQLWKDVKKNVRKVPLKQTMAFTDEMPFNSRWKIIENYKIEIDEI